MSTFLKLSSINLPTCSIHSLYILRSPQQFCTLGKMEPVNLEWSITDITELLTAAPSSNHSTNKVKNERDKRRRIFKQSRKDSGLCDVSSGSYSKKCFTQIHKALYRSPCLRSSDGHNYDGRKLTKTYFTEFCFVCDREICNLITK